MVILYAESPYVGTFVRFYKTWDAAIDMATHIVEKVHGMHMTRDNDSDFKGVDKSHLSFVNDKTNLTVSAHVAETSDDMVAFDKLYLEDSDAAFKQELSVLAQEIDTESKDPVILQRPVKLMHHLDISKRYQGMFGAFNIMDSAA